MRLKRLWAMAIQSALAENSLASALRKFSSETSMRPLRLYPESALPPCWRHLHHNPNGIFAPESSLAPHCAPRPSTALNSAAGQRTVRFALRNAGSGRGGKEGHSAEHEHCARQALLQQKS